MGKKNSNKTEGVWQTKDLCSVCKRVAKDLYKKNKKHKINFFFMLRSFFFLQVDESVKQPY